MKNIYLFVKLSLCLLFMGSAVTYAQFQEDFEGSVPPSGWVIFDNGVGSAQYWQSNSSSYSGSQCAYVRYEAVGSLAEDWLVTPAIAINPGFTNLSFYQKQAYGPDWGTVYTVRVSTVSQTNPADFTIVDTQVETDFGTSYSLKNIDLSAYDGQSVYIAFVMANDDGDNWYIDDVNIGAPPCYSPSNFVISNVTQTSADIDWTANGTGATWESYVVPSGTTPAPPGNFTGTPNYSASNLNPGSWYDVYVREYCQDSRPMMISGAYDGPLTGGLPKGVELYVVEDIPDLSIYGVGFANNGGGSDGIEFTFPAVSATAGSYIYITSDSAEFADFFGFNADYIDGDANINGDDAVELFENSTVIDVFGDINVDGTGQTWEYLDGWALRNDMELNNFGVFNDANWTFSGINQLEGGLTNSTCTSPFPIGTFTTTTNFSIWSTTTFATLCPVQPGDSIQDPIIIPSLPYTDTNTNEACFTDTYGEISADLYYQYIVTDSCIDEIDITLCESDYDTYLWILDAQGNYLDDNDDAGNCPGNQSEILNFPVTLGDTLYFVIEGYDDDTGIFIMDIIPHYMSVSSTVTDIECAGDSSGVADLTGYLSNYTYQWDAAASNQTGATATNLPAGDFEYTATNVSGCEIVDTVTIVELYPALTVSPVITDVLCFGDTTGSAVLNAAGGAGSNLIVDWGAVTPSLLPAGTFPYIVTDSVGCTLEDSVTITEPSALDLSATTVDETLGSDGEIDLTVTGGTPPYNYQWDNGPATEDQTGLTGNTDYTVVVTDNNGCLDSLTVTVSSQVGIADEFPGLGVSVYPNPNNGNFQLILTGNVPNGLVLNLFDPTGRLTLTKQINQSTVTVETEQPAAGLYTLVLTDGTHSYRAQISILR